MGTTTRPGRDLQLRSTETSALPIRWGRKREPDAWVRAPEGTQEISSESTLNSKWISLPESFDSGVGPPPILTRVFEIHHRPFMQGISTFPLELKK